MTFLSNGTPRKLSSWDQALGRRRKGGCHGGMRLPESGCSGLGGGAEGVTCELPGSPEPGAKGEGARATRQKIEYIRRFKAGKRNGKVGKMGRKVRLGKVEVGGHRKSSQVKD